MITVDCSDNAWGVTMISMDCSDNAWGGYHDYCGL